MIEIVVEIVLGCDVGDLRSIPGFLSLILCPSPSRKPLCFLPLFIFIKPHENYFATSVKMVNI